MVREDGEVARFQHVTEMPHGLVDSQQFAIVGAVFLLCRTEFLGEEGEGLPGGVDSTARMASVTSASGAAGSGCASRLAQDKLALHSSKALSSSGVQMMG
jgi:hypothetical protein